MKHLFVPYDIARQLKEKGFNKECFGIYGNNKDLILDDEWLYSTNVETMSETENPTAPLYQQVIDWFREKHGIMVYADYAFENKGKFFGAYCGLNGKYSDTEITDKQNSYYEALTKAIEAALKLI